MKKVIFIAVLLLPLLGKAQAHLGSTLTDIKAMHPDNYFKIDYTKQGQKYAQTEMPLGTFVYYFDSKTGLTDFCIQIPKNMQALNAQVEIYNKKYVILSETSWKAYLEGGGIMYIKLNYDEDYQLYSFSYTNPNE